MAKPLRGSGLTLPVTLRRPDSLVRYQGEQYSARNWRRVENA